MKISGKLVRNRQKVKSCTAGRIQNSADRRISAAALNGKGQFSIVSPWGVEYIPDLNDDAVIISGDSERMCIGIKQRNNYYNIEPGEVVIHSDLDTFIKITNDGKIYLSGDIYVNGQRLEV